MRKDYYRDYTERFRLARKVYNFIEKVKIDSQAGFNFFECCSALRWRPYILNQNKDDKILRNDFAQRIEDALNLLQKVGALKSYESRHEIDPKGKIVINSEGKTIYVPKSINHHFKVSLKEVNSLDELIENSDYNPLEGFPQQLTTDFQQQKEKFFDINYYQKILDYSKRETYHQTAIEFKRNAMGEWARAYEAMKGDALDDDIINSGGFEILCDLPSQFQNEDSYHQDRVIAICGFSKLITGSRKRDANRLAAYRKRHFSDWADKLIDTGHYVAHSLWELDISDSYMDLEFNLYPQKRELNQGRSEEGKLYRQMENYCIKNKGVFLFVRPIYGDTSLRPFVIEYGILKPDLTLWIEQFVNI